MLLMGHRLDGNVGRMPPIPEAALAAARPKIEDLQTQLAGVFAALPYDAELALEFDAVEEETR